MSTHQEDLTIINVYASKNRATKYMKKKTDMIEGRNKQFKNSVCFYRTHCPTIAAYMFFSGAHRMCHI